MTSIKSPVATLLSVFAGVVSIVGTWNGIAAGVLTAAGTGRHLAGSASGAGGAARLGAASSTLTVTRSGSGAGTVTSNVGAINCGVACSDTYNDGTVITLTAAPAAGSQFTGWLGPCSGSGACQFTLDGATTAAATFAPILLGPPSLDIDGNAAFDALTDGLLALRFLFGLSGPALVNSAIGDTPARSSPGDIVDYLADIKPALDIDGNGEADALTDGLLIIRYLFGLRGPNLVAGAVAPGAPRQADTDIEPLLYGLSTPAGTVLPPDPGTVAPPPDPTVVTTILDSTAFLYTGPNPIQTGVAPGTLKPQFAAVLRGTVHTRDGAALSGVTLTLLARPEFGQTKSRADGAFDLAVNGGGRLTVDYRKTGFLPVQRQVSVPWQDYALVPDVVMIPVDAQVTSIALNAPAMQVARGAPTTDADGTRRATVLFPPGTTASRVMPDGTTQPLATLNVRASEYTVGPTGQRAMPGELPPSSAYTYAVELSADEAIAAGAASVQFNQPVVFYVENFVGFPVGSLVPVGYYDKSKGAWVASDNGRVIKVIGITAGMADLDVDGSDTTAGAPALAALGVTVEERQHLAVLYAPGQSLWRVALSHFTPFDCNWPAGPPGGSGPPGPNGGPDGDKGPKDDPCKKGGSIIGCEPQTLGESIQVTGTPFSLNYSSDRVHGRQDRNILPIRLSGATLPPGVQAIHMEIRIAGRSFAETVAPAPNLSRTFTWDGKDAYGRTLYGSQPLTVRIGYEYIAQYYATKDTLEASYNRFGLQPITTAVGGGGAVVFSRPALRSTADPIILWQDYQAALGSQDSLDIKGWSLGVHHSYDARSQILYLGNGGRRSAAGMQAVISTVAGQGDYGYSGNGGTATSAKIGIPMGVAVGPDGSLYISARDYAAVRKVATNGIITTVAGNGASGGNLAQEGGPATQAWLNTPYGVVVTADGALFVCDTANHVIRRVGSDGNIHAVAGILGNFGFSGDGGPATLAKLRFPVDCVVAADGALYIADVGNNRIRRVGTDGIITTIAGSDVTGYGGDGGLATSATLYDPSGLALGSDGSLYVADTDNGRVRRITPDGIITTVAGTGGGGSTGDGGPATLAQIGSPARVAVGPDGSLYISTQNQHRIRRVGPDGIITTVAGLGTAGFAGDTGVATLATMNNPHGIAVGPDNSLYIADNFNYRVRRVRSALPGTSVDDLVIAAEDGSEVYVFSSAGRHLRTQDALTGATRFQFAYDSAGRLATITDGSGNVTTLERDAGGNPTAIVAPFGQRTVLTVQAEGYLASIANPAGETVQFTYNSGAAEGLLATLTDPRGNLHHFFYDALGRLYRDENPAGGVTLLARNDITARHYAVTVTKASGLATTYEVEALATGDERRTRIDPSGAQTVSLLHADGSRQVTYPDGTVSNIVAGPDPRFGMQAPIVKSRTVTKPGGYASTRTLTRTTTLSDPSDPFSLTAQTDTVAINAQVYTSTYSAATHQVTTTTPAGRQSVVTVDALGRMIEAQGDASFGLAPVQFAYDAQGRLIQASQGAQSWTYAYDAQARLASRTDAGGGSTTFAYDTADRATQVTLPSARSYGFAYDASGNRTQVTMPGLGVHLLDYDAIDQAGGYAPPGNNPYLTAHDADGRRYLVTLPGGRTEAFTYDGGNRPLGVAFPEATVTLSYAVGDPTTRIRGLARTPAGAGSAQQIQFTYGGDLVTGANWTGAAAGQFTYAYDDRFKLASIALSGGPTTELTRDNDGLLTALGPFTIARAGPAGAPSQTGDGTLVIAQGYDTIGRVASRTNTVAAQQKYAVQFTYGNTGRIASKVETVAGVAHAYDYTYDSDGHLTQVQNDGAIVERYTYDVNRNRLSRRFGNDPVETASYDAQDRIIQQGGTTYQFNVDGYLTQRGSDTFQYSTTGELLQAVVGGQTVTYAYDGLRRRVSRTDAGGTTQYLYGNPESALQITHARNSSGVLTTYYYDEGRRLFALQRGATRYYVATDQLGSPRVIADATGVVTRATDYDAFGEVIADSNPAFDIVIGYAGGLADSATGLVRFGLRDYDPAAGRWTARDPAVFRGGQTNLYAYVNNNPVNLVDPAGFGSGGVSLCEGVCVGFKLAWTDNGISACVEGGLGVGNSIDVDPMGGLDKDGLSVEAKASLKVGIAKVEFGVEVTDDPCGAPVVTPKSEGCVGPLCLNSDKDSKLSNDLGENLQVKNPLKGEGGVGREAKVVAKFCQQAKW
ncbi:MAG: hypothetical protein IPM02_24415 [Betaproteobacteria bacterium]|nr:hypothetical protein [Betaproteobacteria bacterium]